MLHGNDTLVTSSLFRKDRGRRSDASKESLGCAWVRDGRVVYSTRQLRPSSTVFRDQGLCRDIQKGCSLVVQGERAKIGNWSPARPKAVVPRETPWRWAKRVVGAQSTKTSSFRETDRDVSSNQICLTVLRRMQSRLESEAVGWLLDGRRGRVSTLLSLKCDFVLGR